MQNEKSFWQKISGFAEGKGFYIILALCAVAIGISGYVLFFAGNTAEPQMNDPQTQVVSDPPPQSPVNTIPDVDVGIEPLPQPPVIPPENTEPPVPERPVNNPVNVEVTPGYMMPVDGQIIREFSGMQLVYDNTMNDWRTHNGTDFECLEGAPVSAIGAGKIEDIYADEMTGSCIVLKLEDGTLIKYCGVVAEKIKKGDKVKGGDRIGKADGSILCEVKENYHIHIEVFKGDKRIDPMSLELK